MAVRRIEGMLHLANEDRYAILVGRFNSFVVEHLLEGAIDTLKRPWCLGTSCSCEKTGSFRSFRCHHRAWRRDSW